MKAEINIGEYHLELKEDGFLDIKAVEGRLCILPMSGGNIGLFVARKDERTIITRDKSGMQRVTEPVENTQQIESLEQ